MAASGTSLWPTLLAGQKAKASEVETKFDWLEANILPMLSGSTTDLTYNLGSPTVRWAQVYTRSINATTTAGPLVVGTTTAAHASDVSFEAVGPGAFLVPRLTTTQRGNLTGINGFLIYNATTNNFQIYQNGGWLNMGGTNFGLIDKVFTQTTLDTTVTLYNFGGVGRLKSLYMRFPTAGVTHSVNINIDSVTSAAFSIVSATEVTFYLLGGTSTAYFSYTSGAITGDVNYDIYFNENFSVTHSSNSNGNTATMFAVLETQ